MEFEQIGKYKIQAEIGQGAMGVVYRAHDPILNREVAIKTISAALGSDDDLRKRFHREAQAAARLNHPNIITVFDFGEEHGKIYMAMELLEGTDLKDVMAAGTLVTLDDKLAVMEQILDGLAFAHAKEVVHRDLKPGNIHIQPNGQIKIMDFGLARLGSSEMTQAGVVMGTPNYMSPEQVLGEKVDVRSDIFAMGAVFYELITSHKPFEAESMHGVLFQVVHKEPQQIRKWAPDLPPVLVQIVEKCLIKDKNKRFQNAGELREAVAMARQALLSGRISEATLDMESGKVFLEAEEFEGGDEPEDSSQPPRSPRSWPPNKPEGQWVDGTVALDQAPLEEVLDQPAPPASANKSHPTLSGRSRTAINRQQTQRGLPAPPPQASRAPIYIGGGLALVAAAIGGFLWWQKAHPPIAPIKPPSAVVQLLIETRNELAQKNLDDKDYKKAIETVESTMTMAKEENVPDGYKQLVQARKILTEARTKFTAIESTASEAEDAFRANNGELAAQKLGQLIELDPEHPVATELSPKLNKFFAKQAEDARQMMTLAKDQAEKVSNSATFEYRSEGREDMGKANSALGDAESALKKQAYAQATRQFLEARDAYDRSRRAIETKISDAAQKDQELRKQLKVPAEESRKTMAAARTLAEQAGAASSAGAEEFKVGVDAAKAAETAMGTNDYLVAKKSFDDSRIAFERARQAALRPPPTLATQPPATLPPVTQPPVTAPPATQGGTLPPVTAPPVTLPPKIPVGRLQANAASTTQLSSGKVKGFEDATNPEFTGEMELEVSPAQIAVGEAFTVKVTLNNTGKKAMKLKEMVGTTRVNAAPGPALTANLKVRDVPMGQKVVVGEITGTWADAVNTWVMEAKVTGDKGDSAANKVVFKKGQ